MLNPNQRHQSPARLLIFVLVFTAQILVSGSLVAQPPQQRDWIRLGLELTKSGNAGVRDHGWQAIQYGLSLTGQNSDPDVASHYQEVIAGSIQQNSSRSFSALVSLCLASPDLRKKILTQPESFPEAQRDVLQRAASIAVLHSPEVADNTLQAVADIRSLFQTAPSTVLYALVSDSNRAHRVDIVKAIFPDLLKDKRPVAVMTGAYLSSAKQLQEDAGLSTKSRLQLLESVGSAAAVAPADSSRTSIASATENLSADLSQSLSLKTLLSGYALQPVQNPQPAPNRAPAVTLVNSSLLYHVEQSTATVGLNVNSLVTPPEYFQRENVAGIKTYGIAQATANGQPMKCAAAAPAPPGSNNDGSRYMGACFAPLSTGAQASETPSTGAAALGVAYRIWGKTVHINGIPGLYHPPHDFVVNGDVTIQLRSGFAPTSGTNWVAARPRWGSDRPGQWQITSGTLSQNPAATENATKWQIFALTPGQTLEFSMSVTPTPQYSTSDTRQDVLELLEIDSSNLPGSGLSNPLDLARLPPDLANPPDGNAILRYASALQEGLNDGGWLAPMNGEQTSNALLALARFSQLTDLASMSLDASVGPLPPQQRILIQQWQSLLKNSLPLIAYRVYARYEPALETEAALIAGTMPHINKVRGDLLHALQQLDVLTADQVRAQLEAADRLNHTNSDGLSEQNLDLLLTSLVGASHGVDDLAAQQTFQLQMRCNLLGLLTGPRLDGLPSMQPRQEVLDACSDLSK